MTLKLSRPPPPIAAGDDPAGVDPDAELEAAALALAVHPAVDLDRRADGAVGVVGERLGRAEDGHQPVALELVDVAAVGGDDRDDDLEQRVEAGDDLAGAALRRRSW